HAMTDALPRAFRDANEEFYGRVLNGRSGSRPRWRVCVASAARDEGESLGREYVRRLSSAEARRFATGLVEGVERALVATVGQLAWMDDPARAEAARRLQAVANEIVGPGAALDESGLEFR